MWPMGAPTACMLGGGFWGHRVYAMGRRDAIPKSNPHGRVVHRSAQSLLLAL